MLVPASVWNRGSVMSPDDGRVGVPAEQFDRVAEDQVVGLVAVDPVAGRAADQHVLVLVALDRVGPAEHPVRGEHPARVERQAAGHVAAAAEPVGGDQGAGRHVAVLHPAEVAEHDVLVLPGVDGVLAVPAEDDQRQGRGRRVDRVVVHPRTGRRRLGRRGPAGGVQDEEPVRAFADRGPRRGVQVDRNRVVAQPGVEGRRGPRSRCGCACRRCGWCRTRSRSSTPRRRRSCRPPARPRR